MYCMLPVRVLSTWKTTENLHKLQEGAEAAARILSADSFEFRI